MTAAAIAGSRKRPIDLSADTEPTEPAAKQQRQDFQATATVQPLVAPLTSPPPLLAGCGLLRVRTDSQQANTWVPHRLCLLQLLQCSRRMMTCSGVLGVDLHSLFPFYLGHVVIVCYSVNIHALMDHLLALASCSKLTLVSDVGDFR